MRFELNKTQQQQQKNNILIPQIHTLDVAGPAFGTRKWIPSSHLLCNNRIPETERNSKNSVSSFENLVGGKNQTNIW